jgi:RNA polymerase sigma-70 factor (ECF subfamily)
VASGPGLDDILRRAQRADPDALADIVRFYSTRLFGLLNRLTGSRDAAEDLLQETFLRVVGTIGAYEDRGRFESWLFRIAANLARDHLRRSRLRRVQSLDAAGPNGEPRTAGPAPVEWRPLERLEEADRCDALLAALEQLGDAEREVILLRHYSELSFRQIADLLGIPLGTALARGHRGLRRLRALLAGTMTHEETG